VGQCVTFSKGAAATAATAAATTTATLFSLYAVNKRI